MAKSIIKEIGIVILLLIAIAIVLAIVFYDYIPNNKTIPTKIQAYTIPEDIKNELADSTDSQENIIITHYIDNADLDAYESTNNYDKGKPNPFADYLEGTTENQTNSTGNNSNTANGSTNTGTNNNFNSNDNINNNSNSNQNESVRNEAYITTPGKTY